MRTSENSINIFGVVAKIKKEVGRVSTMCILLLLVTVMLTACGNPNINSKGDSVNTTKDEGTIPNLEGTWKQVDANSESWIEAVIKGDEIEIYWVTDEEDYSLYWAGTVQKPSSEGDYSWISENDKGKTEFALLASSDDTKEISYKGGELVYTGSMMGTQYTMHLDKISDEGELRVESKSNIWDDDLDAEDKDDNATIDETGIYYSDMPGNKEDIIANIAVETKSTGEVMAVILTNNNPFVIPDLDLTVVFYRNGAMIDSDSDGHDVILPEGIVASRIDVPDEYDDFEVQIDVDWKYATNYRNWTDGIELESNIGDENVMIKFTNNSGTDIEELEYIVLYYNGGELVDVGFPHDRRLDCFGYQFLCCGLYNQLTVSYLKTW